MKAAEHTASRPSQADIELWQRLSGAQREYEVQQPDPWLWPEGPLYQHAARDDLEQLHSQFDAGDKGALMAAVHKCAKHGLPMPIWLSKAFIKGYSQVLNCRTDSWDEAFGKPFPPRARLSALRRNRLLRHSVPMKIKEIRDSDGFLTGRRPAIDNELFERVALIFNTNRDVVSKLWKGRLRTYNERHPTQR